MTQPTKKEILDYLNILIGRRLNTESRSGFTHWAILAAIFYLITAIFNTLNSNSTPAFLSALGYYTLILLPVIFLSEIYFHMLFDALNGEEQKQGQALIKNIRFSRRGQMLVLFLTIFVCIVLGIRELGNGIIETPSSCTWQCLKTWMYQSAPSMAIAFHYINLIVVFILIVYVVFDLCCRITYKEFHWAYRLETSENRRPLHTLTMLIFALTMLLGNAIVGICIVRTMDPNFSKQALLCSLNLFVILRLSIQLMKIANQRDDLGKLQRVERETFLNAIDAKEALEQLEEITDGAKVSKWLEKRLKEILSLALDLKRHISALDFYLQKPLKNKRPKARERKIATEIFLSKTTLLTEWIEFNLNRANVDPQVRANLLKAKKKVHFIVKTLSKRLDRLTAAISDEDSE